MPLPSCPALFSPQQAAEPSARTAQPTLPPSANESIVLLGVELSNEASAAVFSSAEAPQQLTWPPEVNPQVVVSLSDTWE
jgi:hypothetical protein